MPTHQGHLWGEALAAGGMEVMLEASPVPQGCTGVHPHPQILSDVNRNVLCSSQPYHPLAGSDVSPDITPLMGVRLGANTA